MTVLLKLRVHSITWEAEGVRSIELRAPSGEALPPGTAGSHIDLRLAGGIERSYSLINPGDTGAYRFAVQRAPDSRGGSAYLVDQLRVGEWLEVTPPVDGFALVEAAEQSTFIAGGIGITPIWAMVQTLEALGRPWQLHYCVRNLERAAFLAPLQQLEQRSPGRVTIWAGNDPARQRMNLAQVIAGQAPNTHLYCCGPAGMIEAFESATANRPPEQVHREYFAAAQAPAEGGFEVVLARRGVTVAVAQQQTILEALLEQGLDLPRSCMSGVCGTCETRVLEGRPDHRDQVLSEREQAANRKIMICCSGSLDPRLVLDL